ncbi:unnamed protein product [Porites evermanni]|uniref:Uncharacterized protein n=1 Tax=Porites evermanni TaxID=104178 RepID=A0ABN8RDF2_9CNID|nr:unnamed protein product [Porites evermanni]
MELLPRIHVANKQCKQLHAPFMHTRAKSKVNPSIQWKFVQTKDDFSLKINYHLLQKEMMSSKLRRRP